MGASFSAPEVERFSLGELPESCIALIMSKLDPPEICQLARLNKAFRRASTADLVWITKLPSNNDFLARKLFDEMPLTLSKFQFYASLCTPIRFDGGSKEVWLEKRSGKMCISLSWKGLTITGIHDRRYWTHISSHESRLSSSKSGIVFAKKFRLLSIQIREEGCLRAFQWIKQMNEPLDLVDPEIAGIIELEKGRQRKSLYARKEHWKHLI